MQIYRMSVPGNDVVVHQMTTRRGGRLCLVEGPAGDWHLCAYDGSDLDAPRLELVLESDEADQIAEVLHSRPLKDRLLSLERRVDELIGERGR
jgi:TrkA domain protein